MKNENNKSEIIYQAIGTEAPYIGVILASSKPIKYKGLSKEQFREK